MSRNDQIELKDANVLRFDLAFRYLAYLDNTNETRRFLETPYARPRVWATPNVVRLIMNHRSETIETICLLKNLHAIRVMFVCAFSSIVGFFRGTTDRFGSIDNEVMTERARTYDGANALPFVDFQKMTSEEETEMYARKALASLVDLSNQKQNYYAQFPIDPCDESRGDVVGPHDRVRWFLECEIAALRFECDRYRSVFREFSDDDYVNWEIRCLEWFVKKMMFLMHLIAARRRGETLPAHADIVAVMLETTPWYDKNDGFLTGYLKPSESFNDARDEHLKQLREEFKNYQEQFELKRRLLLEPSRPVKRSHDLLE